MNGFIGWILLITAWLSFSDVIHYAHDKVSITLALVVLSGIFFIRQEVKELRDLIFHNHTDQGDKPNGFRPRQG